MDASVLRAMDQWPDVPAAFGWLALDQRGRWLLRGKVVDLPLSIAFFNRNFTCDDQGRWFVQNGPQRVFVTLDYLPLIWQLNADGVLKDQTGHELTDPQTAYIDEYSNLIVVDEAGPGRVADEALFPVLDELRDGAGGVLGADGLDALMAGQGEAYLHLCGQKLRVGTVEAKALPDLFGFQKTPSEGQQPA